MHLNIAFSPCPNDTFIFDALINHKIDTEDLKFEAVLEDVETLNKWAIEEKHEITKLSFPAFFEKTDAYMLLNAGSALGEGVGPLLISKNGDINPDDIEKNKDSLEFALPGAHTTANLLFNYAWPGMKHIKHMVFSEIEEAVLKGNADMGVIIHENRFTYQQKGLHKVMDLGEYWEKKMQAPIPLGGIAIKRSIEEPLRLKVDALIRKSIEYAFANLPALPDYVRVHSQTMSEAVMRQHIDLYVNDYSIGLGEVGKKAILTLYDTWNKMYGGEHGKFRNLFN